MTYPDYLDVRSQWARDVGLSTRPSFMVVGRDGRIVYRVAAVLWQSAPEFQQLSDAIDHALGAPAAQH
jgi:hypothetical protein